jgi:hypothetical protein
MRVGFIGLGTMDGKMAAGLQRTGYDLTVHDMRLEAAAPHLAVGTTWADSPKKVAEACDVVLTSLPGPPEVEKVALGGDGLCGGCGRADRHISTYRPIRRLSCAVSIPPSPSMALTCWTRRSAAVREEPLPASSLSGSAEIERSSTGTSRCWTRSAIRRVMSVRSGQRRLQNSCTIAPGTFCNAPCQKFSRWV